MKLEEITEFLIDWGDQQQLTVHEGLAMVVGVLTAGPLPVQVSTRSSTYMAVGTDVPESWLELFAAAADAGAIEANLTFVSRVEDGFLTQVLSLMPCEQGEHMHASASLTHTLVLEGAEPLAEVQAALVEAWRRVGDGMAELQDRWFHPFLEQALELETLHGGS